MAKTNVPKTKQPRIPPALEEHIQNQQDAVLTVSCLLDAITRAIEPLDGDVVTQAVISLRHVRQLAESLHLELDVVSIDAVAGVQS